MDADGKGILVACVESIQNPQPDFHKLKGDPDELAGAEDFLKNLMKDHFAKGAKWFPIGESFDYTGFCGAITSSLKTAVAYRRENPERSMWYRTEPITNVGQWIVKMCKLSGDQRFAFRGQGDEKWRLETGLGRRLFRGDECSEVEIEKVLNFEKFSMQLFEREVSKFPEYQTFTGVNLLSLMQHYGSMTRLLDFSFSPLIALYMAIDQYDQHLNNVKTYLKTLPSHSDKVRLHDAA